MNLLVQLEQWLIKAPAYVLSCWSLPMTAPVCQQFWYWVMIASFVIGMWILVAIVWKVMGDTMRMRRLRRMMAEREARTPQEIERAKWIGDNAYPSDVPPEDLERHIRDGLDQHRRKSAGLDPPYG